MTGSLQRQHLLFRPAQQEDVGDIQYIAANSGVGVTTLPHEKAQCQSRVAHSQASFAKALSQPGDENYLFVLEDTQLNKVVGTAGIVAYTGIHSPLYNYKVSSITRMSDEVNIKRSYQVLFLVNDYHHCSEIATLMLMPEYRQQGIGLFLSRARFLFMAQFPQRFATMTIAEMRGYLDSHGESPFWQALGQHFFSMDFAEADRLTGLTNKQFIADLMPRHPIYVNLLSATARDVIGKPHDDTQAAFRILKKEGFEYRNYIDIFDAGPIVEAPTRQINTVRDSRVCNVTTIKETVAGSPVYVSNARIDFRALFTDAVVDDAGICLSTATAQLLHVQQGDDVRIYTP